MRSSSGLMKWAAAWLGLASVGVAMAAGAADCKAPPAVAGQLPGLKAKGLHVLDTGVNWYCAKGAKAHCCKEMLVTVTLDEKDPSKCIATLNYASLTINIKNGHSPKLVWTLKWDAKTSPEGYFFDQAEGIKIIPLVPPQSLPVAPPTGFDSGSTKKFKWQDTGQLGAANHYPVVHPNGQPAVSCEPRDPGIVNTQ